MAKQKEQDVDVLEVEQEYSLSGGDFFKQNPSKVLAEPYEGSGRFGPVIKYRPKAGKKPEDVLSELDTPVFIGHGITDLSAGVSVIASSPESPVSAEDDANNAKAIEESEKIIVKRLRSEKRKVQDFDEPQAPATIPFEDILRNYNPELSEDEIKAFLWYQHHSGLTFRGRWLNFFNPTVLSQEQESAFIQKWVQEGILFYYKGELLPAYVYFSENLYDKKEQFEQRDREEIERIYGEKAAGSHQAKLQDAFSEVYNNRLKLDDPTPEKRLHLKPYGDFTDGVEIRNWNLDNKSGEPKEFLVVLSAKGGINWYSAKTSLSEWKDTKKEKLSVSDAFRWWLKYDPDRPEIGHNFNWEDIFKYYLDKKAVKTEDATVVARKRALAKDAGDKLFSRFLAEVIIENDRVMIERLWNERFNSSRGLRTGKIPIAFECALNYPGNEPVDIRPEKREAVAFATVRGSSLNAYQVGVGKTWAAILTMAQFLDAGLCKRPFLVVPNQVYKQFYSEIRGILPHRKINDLYNLGNEYIEKLLDENGKVMAVEEGSISILTYEGFEQVGFNEDTQYFLLDHLRDALLQITSVPVSDKKAQKQGERDTAKLEGLLGKALQKTRTNIEDLGFDFVCFDEAHALKNIFGNVKGRPVTLKESEGDKEDEDKRGKKMYELQGSTSTRGVKAYCLCSYIQNLNQGRNILLLTATPFTNNPLEVFSMLSLVAYAELKQMALSNINSFFDNYAMMTHELVINSKLQPVRIQVFKAFDNLLSLQKLVYRYMLHKEAGKPDVNGFIIPLIRPDKWVLPYKGRFNDKNEFIPAGENEVVDTVLPLTKEQKELMEEIVEYVEGEISYEDLQSRGQSRKLALEGAADDSEESQMTAMEILLDEGSMNSDEKAGVRTLRGVNFARSLALSPYLYEFSGLGEPDYKGYVEKSPKLLFIMNCIKSVKKWHEDNKEPVSGQVIYMDRGKVYFDLLKEYLVKVLGYKPHEVGIIRSGKEGTAKHKDTVKNGFLGLKFNENTKSFSDVTDDERIKVIIGTSSIREGMNLQRYATVLYNAFVDWNPTDQIQLEGRIWRQGNSFKNVRIVLPQMSDSMDIFMFQKLELKTDRINSIWNYDGKSNVLKVEELDPREQKLALVTNPRVIAELEVEDEQTKISEEIADVQSHIDTARNIIGFYQKRDKFEKDLTGILAVINPGKEYSSIEVMMKDFEIIVEKAEDEDSKYSTDVADKLRAKYKSRYDNELLNYYFVPWKPYSYGSYRGAVVMLKKAKRSFLERNGIADDQHAIADYIAEQEGKIKRMEDDRKHLSSDDYLNTRAAEIEDERKRKKIKAVSLDERVREFEKLNYLLGIKRDKGMVEVEEFMQAEIKGCPPLTKDGKPDVSVSGISKLEACLERVPQTRELHTDETGQYNEKRLKLHAVIKGKLRAGLHCKTTHEKPVAIFTGGVPGSGKTTFLRKYAPNLEKEKIFRIDADEIRAMLPEYQGWNSSATHKETQDIYKGLLKDISEGKPCRFDILWDGTMNKPENYLPLIGDLRRLNYEIYMIYVKVPWDVSRKRTIERYVKGFSDGKYGRYVPQSVVDAANKDGGRAFEELKLKADGFLVVDGMSGEITEKGGRDLLADRGYFDRVPTEKDKKVKIAKAIALAQKQKIEILKLKGASEMTPAERELQKRQEFNASLLSSVAPYKEAFLKRKGLTYNDESRLSAKQKNKLQKEWLKSQEYQDMENRDKKEVWEKYNK